MFRPLYALLIAGAAGGAFAQSASKLEFEVVSVKPSPDPEPGRPVNVGCHGGPGTADPAMFRCTNMSFGNLLLMAYSVMPYQLSGPDWLRTQRFEVTAKLPEGIAREQLSLMLQNMLAERFKLALHHETKVMAKYELTVAKSGSKLKTPAADSGPRSADPPVPMPAKLDKDMFPVLKPGQQGTIMENGRARMFHPNWTVQQFAQILSVQMGKPVIDATGLIGKYDISLYWAADTLRAGPGDDPPPGDPGPTLEQAIQDQLGLRLVSTKGPVDFIVVDHLEKLPTDN